MNGSIVREGRARRFGPIAAAALLFGVTLTVGSAMAAAGHTRAGTKASNNTVHFKLIASPGIAACLANAGGKATITPGDLNDTMTVTVHGLAPNTGYDLFVLEIPNKPFGIAWYQSDLETNGKGKGSATVQGIFNDETFSVATGGPTVTFGATHQYHLGLWFNDPNVPFDLGCEPGATSPTITPFNGEQNAGIQVLNTANFPDDAGPLSKVSG